jgi:hypothetical protein
MTEPARRPDELLLDELTDQLDRTRRLLTGSPADAAERALSSIGGASEADSRLVSQIAVATPLAQPDRFDEAHRLVMISLEVLDRDGFRDPPVVTIGPFRALARPAVEFIAKYIIRSFTRRVVDDLATLYSQRESQSVPASSLASPSPPSGKPSATPATPPKTAPSSSPPSPSSLPPSSGSPSPP